MNNKSATLISTKTTRYNIFNCIKLKTGNDFKQNIFQIKKKKPHLTVSLNCGIGKNINIDWKQNTIPEKNYNILIVHSKIIINFENKGSLRWCKLIYHVMTLDKEIILIIKNNASLFFSIFFLLILFILIIEKNYIWSLWHCKNNNILEYDIKL